VFYMREFVGSDGKIHYYRKFRTMLKDADKILRCNPELKAEFVRQYKLKNDPRLLRLGRFMRRFSIDEFPQFFSVLIGKLTFVGPRVICEEEKRLYGELLPKLLSVKPGLTGFWQVMGRQTTTYGERVRMDMFYVERWSILARSRHYRQDVLEGSENGRCVLIEERLNVKILVTGAAGFVASHVADAYVSAGHEVVIVDDLSRGAEKNVNPKARFYRCDIRDREAIEKIFLLEKPAVVNHHAAQMDVRRGVREPVFDAQVNILGSLNLMEAALAHGTKRFIYIASAGQVTENQSKRSFPKITRSILSLLMASASTRSSTTSSRSISCTGWEYVVLRYGNVYGPRQSSQGEAGVFAIFSEQCLPGSNRSSMGTVAKCGITSIFRTWLPQMSLRSNEVATRF